MKILLPIDGSDCSQKTLHWAAELFKQRHDVDFHLLEVISITPDTMTVEYDISDATKTLSEARKTLENQGCRVSRISYVLGDVVERICEYAEEHRMDQILIGSHGRTGLSKLLMGSVSVAVMERSKCPVTLYRNVERSPIRHVLPANTLL
jgi:nucleotide-binding universal stress UspA family protein